MSPQSLGGLGVGIFNADTVVMQSTTAVDYINSGNVVNDCHNVNVVNDCR